jgi:hypothetical protein
LQVPLSCQALIETFIVTVLSLSRSGLSKSIVIGHQKE